MKDIDTFACDYIGNLEKAARSVDLRILRTIADRLWTAYEEKRTVFVFGNGGSASTASHLATDLGKGTLGHRGDLPAKGFKVVSLSDNSALMTAWANDAGYERVFAGPLERLVEPGDVVIAISASGNSPNVLAGTELATSAGATTIALAGFDGGRLAAFCDLAVVVDSYDYGIVEDVHMCLVHIIGQHLRDRLFREVTVSEVRQGSQ